MQLVATESSTQKHRFAQQSYFTATHTTKIQLSICHRKSASFIGGNHWDKSMHFIEQTVVCT
jgi:hypothetical protein